MYCSLSLRIVCVPLCLLDTTMDITIDTRSFKRHAWTDKYWQLGPVIQRVWNVHLYGYRGKCECFVCLTNLMTIDFTFCSFYPLFYFYRFRIWTSWWGTAGYCTPGPYFGRLCAFSQKNKATLDKVSYGSGQKCSKELRNHSFTSVEAIVVKVQWKMCENQYFPCFEP